MTINTTHRVQGRWHAVQCWGVGRAHRSPKLQECTGVLILADPTSPVTSVGGIKEEGKIQEQLLGGRKENIGGFLQYESSSSGKILECRQFIPTALQCRGKQACC